MNIQPKPAMLDSKRNANMGWPIALSELIDNAFDAGATNVSIRFGPGKRVSVTDNGCGCDSPESMLTLGDHYRRKSTRLGRYGVGAKDAALWLWGKWVIKTTVADTCLKFSIDWSSRRPWQPCL